MESQADNYGGVQGRLGHAETLLRSILSQMGLGLAFYESAGDLRGRAVDYRVREVNGRFEVLTGLSKENLIGKRVFDVWKAIIGSFPGWAAAFEEVASRGGEATFESYSESTGRWFRLWVLSHSVGSFVTVLEDITERRLEQEAMHLGEERVEALVNAATDFACLLDRDGRILALNRGMATQLGREKDELIGRSIFALFAGELVRNRRPRFEEVIATGMPVYEQDERHGRTYDYTLYPVFGADAEVEGVAVCAKDITEQKKAQDLLLHAERMRAVGDMAAGVAHNFSNVLQVVMGRAQFALANLDLGKTGEMRKNLEEIVENSRSGAKVVKMLERFAGVRDHGSGPERSVFDLSDTVAAAIEMSKPWWKTSPEKDGIRILLRKSLQPGCMVNGRDGELFEVALNLIKNAAEAVSGGGEITIDTFLKDGEVVLSVHDTGGGIAKKNIGRVFEPFWTTKGSRGTGMGLAGTMGIVKLHGGHIDVESQPRKGTTFNVRLNAEPETEKRMSTESIEKASKNLKILIVDDMEPVLRSLEQGFKRLDHQVSTALSGREAMDVFTQMDFDMVICDLAMPEMNGWEVGTQIKRISAERGVSKPIFVLLTGWGGEHHSEEEKYVSGVDAVIEKPTDIPRLIEVYQELALERAAF